MLQKKVTYLSRELDTVKKRDVQPEASETLCSLFIVVSCYWLYYILILQEWQAKYKTFKVEAINRTSLQSQNANSENELETCKTQISKEQKKNDDLIDMVMYMCSVHVFLYY